MNRVHNIMEEIVQQVIEDYRLQRPDRIHCDQCVADIKAIALNRIPPKYVASHKGEVFSKTTTLVNQSMSDIYREISIAIERVTHRPNCD